MGIFSSKPRIISFPTPKILSTNPPKRVEPDDLWIYFPSANQGGYLYLNSSRSWWLRFSITDDIMGVKRLNGFLEIKFKPGQAGFLDYRNLMIIPFYKTNLVGKSIVLTVPIDCIISNPS